MQNENKYPLHSHYLLLNSHTKSPVKITLCSNNYMFIANRQYFANLKEDFFSLKEKLYILNLSYDVIWSPISVPQLFYKTLFYNATSPLNLKLNIAKGKVTPYISKKGVF